jgi:hypothetical protein
VERDVLVIEGQRRTRTAVALKLQGDGSWLVTNRTEGGTLNGVPGTLLLPPSPVGVSVRTHDRLEHIRIEGHPAVEMGRLDLAVGRPRAAHVIPDLIELIDGRAQALVFGAGAVEVKLSNFHIRGAIRCQGWCHMQLVDGSGVGGDFRIRGARPFKLRSSAFLLDMDSGRVGGRVSVRNTELVRMWVRNSVIRRGLKVDGGATFIDLCDSEVGPIGIRNKGKDAILPGNIVVLGNLRQPETRTDADALLRLESTDIRGPLRLNHRAGTLEIGFDAAHVSRKFRVRARGGFPKGLTIDQSSFGDRIDVELGDGDDLVEIDATDAPAPARSELRGDVKIHLGLGDDTLMIGHDDSPSPRAVFEQGADFDGGKGIDVLMIQDGAAFAEDVKMKRFE